MRPLQSQIRRYSKAQWALAGGLLLATAVFYALGYRPLAGRLQSLKAQTEAERRGLTQNLSKAGELPSLTLRVERLQARVERHGKTLPRQPDMGQFMKDITQVGQQSMLRQFEVHPLGSRRGDLFFELPISMKFEADFMNASMFLRQLEDLQRLTRIRHLDFRGKDARQGTVEVEVTMNIYFSEG
jgi:Tfp pilus assembly protein PilO